MTKARRNRMSLRLMIQKRASSFYTLAMLPMRFRIRVKPDHSKSQLHQL